MVVRPIATPALLMPAATPVRCRPVACCRQGLRAA